MNTQRNVTIKKFNRLLHNCTITGTELAYPVGFKNEEEVL